MNDNITASGTLPVLLTRPDILLLGGGATALRKAAVLSDNGIPFRVIAECVVPELARFNVSIVCRRVIAADIEVPTIVIDATGDVAVQKLLLAEKDRRYFLLNCIANPEISDFYFASLVNRGSLKIAVSTDGASPTIGQLVRDRIADVIPEDLGSIVSRKKLDRERGIIAPAETAAECVRRLSTVYLIGCGPGDPELLTLKAYRLIQQLDVVLYDHLLTPEILDLVPASTVKIPVGKRKGHHSYKQEQINELLWEKAQQGLRVGRLKNGDPFIFGRGSEEVDYLLAKGVRVEVVNGISSALAGPACAWIPPTARGYATNLSIVSAHLAENKFNTDWLPLLKIPHHTTVILMGLSFAAKISQRVMAEGGSGAMPVAVISNASRPNQTVIVTDIEHLPEQAAGAERPALLVIGDVVNLHRQFTGAG